MSEKKPKRKPPAQRPRIERWILVNKDGTELSWEHHENKAHAIAEGRRMGWKGVKPVKLVEAR